MHEIDGADLNEADADAAYAETMLDGSHGYDDDDGSSASAGRMAEKNVYVTSINTYGDEAPF